MSALTLHAPAKLNLALHITGRRADGYHLLESLVAFTEFGDEITLEASDRFELQVVGEFANEAGGGENNLVMRAAKLLQSAAQVKQGARITLTKNIPAGAGLGGGSADAAAVLKGLQKLWNIALPAGKLDHIALTLGADVPMCLRSQPLIARGVGEELAPLTQALPTLSVVLVHPRMPLLSKDVYAQLHYPMGKSSYHEAMELPISAVRNVASFIAWLKSTRNDLQRPAIAVSPLVAELLLAMETALPTPALVRMTGSGACCFALFERADDAQRFAHNFSAEYPNFWLKNTRISA